jgi:biopolymer transport protein TolR
MAATAPATRSAVVATPNVTPMIDVMLVLLIIFMLVVPAIDATVQLPAAAEAQARPERTEERTLAIDAGGRHVLGGRAVAPVALARELARLLAADTLDRVLYVKADTALDYAVVREAMARASEAGFAIVGLVTVPPASAP